MVSGAWRSGVSSLSRVNGIGRYVKWMGAWGASTPEAGFAGNSAGSEATEARPAPTSRAANEGRPRLRLHGFRRGRRLAEFLNRLLLSVGVLGAAGSRISAKQIETRSHHLRCQFPSFLQFVDRVGQVPPGCEHLAVHHVRRGMVGLDVHGLF